LFFFFFDDDDDDDDQINAVLMSMRLLSKTNMLTVGFRERDLWNIPPLPQHKIQH